MNKEKKEINSREDCEWFGVRTPQKPCGQCNKDCQYNDNKTQKNYQTPKEIEEMARIILSTKSCEALVVSECIKRKCQYPHYSDITCLSEHQAEALVNAGYGKVEDYKKEIARLKELITKIKEMVDKNFYYDDLTTSGELSDLLKKYGIGEE